MKTIGFIRQEVVNDPLRKKQTRPAVKTYSVSLDCENWERTDGRTDNRREYSYHYRPGVVGLVDQN